jgi:hypothetical protein
MRNHLALVIHNVLRSAIPDLPEVKLMRMNSNPRKPDPFSLQSFGFFIASTILLSSCASQRANDRPPAATLVTPSGAVACAIHKSPLVEVEGWCFDGINPPCPLPQYVEIADRFPNGIPFGCSLHQSEHTPRKRNFHYCPECEKLIVSKLDRSR